MTTRRSLLAVTKRRLLRFARNDKEKIAALAMTTRKEFLLLIAGR
jgi:hypothetical protein